MLFGADRQLLRLFSTQWSIRTEEFANVIAAVQQLRPKSRTTATWPAGRAAPKQGSASRWEQLLPCRCWQESDSRFAKRKDRWNHWCRDSIERMSAAIRHRMTGDTVHWTSCAHKLKTDILRCTQRSVHCISIKKSHLPVIWRRNLVVQDNSIEKKSIVP